MADSLPLQNKSPASLTGLAQTLWVRLRRTASELAGRGWMQRILPGVPVKIHDGGGQATWLTMPGFVPLPAGSGPKRHCSALLLPDTDFLQRRISLPLSSLAESMSAMQLEVETATPFALEKTVWGWCERPAASGMFVADIAITSRRQIKMLLAGNNVNSGRNIEVWAQVGEGGYAIFSGFGEKRRQRMYWRALLQQMGLCVVVAGLILGLMLVPMLHKRGEVIAAQNYQNMLVGQSGEVHAIREQLSALMGLQEQIGPRIESEPDARRVLDVLTVALPDGTWIDSLEYTPHTLRISGYADDAIALQLHLQEVPLFAGVRVLSSIMRQANLNKDRFSFEVELKS